MIFLILFIIVVAGVGTCIGKISMLLKTSESVLTVIYYFSLFIIAAIFRFDDKITADIDKIGWQSFMLLIAAFAASLSLIWITYKIFLRMIHKGNIV